MADNLLIARNWSKKHRTDDPQFAEAFEALIKEVEILRLKAGVEVPIESGNVNYNTNSFLTASGLWTVSPANLKNLSFSKNGNEVTIYINISTSTLSAASAWLAIKLSPDLAPDEDVNSLLTRVRNGANYLTSGAHIQALKGNRALFLYSTVDRQNWPNSADLAIEGQITFKLKT